MRFFRKTVTTVQALVQIVTDILLSVSAVSVILLIGFMAVEVASRYLLRSSTSWSFEMSTLSFGAIFLLGTAGALRHGHHVRMDLLYQRFSRKRQNTIDGVLYVVLLLPCLILLTQQLWARFWETYQSGETTGYSAWNPPLWPFTALILLGVAALTLQVLAEALKIVADPAKENGE